MNQPKSTYSIMSNCIYCKFVQGFHPNEISQVLDVCTDIDLTIGFNTDYPKFTSRVVWDHCIIRWQNIPFLAKVHITHTHTHTHTHAHTHLYIYIYIYIYTHTHTHIHTHNMPYKWINVYVKYLI